MTRIPLTLEPARPARPAGSLGPSPTEQRRLQQVRRMVLALLVLCILAVALYLAWNLRGPLAYALDLRGRQVGALIVVGIAVGASTVAFQTVSGSRILTPGVMGFDSLFTLIQTVMVYALGATALTRFGVVERFGLNLVALAAFGLLLFRWLFRAHSRNLFVLMLVGIVLGTFFASLSTFASRLLSPDDYLTLQSVLFASFTTVDERLLFACAAVTLLASVGLFALAPSLDVVDLGHERCVTLGVDHHRVVTQVLVLVTVLVASSTALVGPMIFLGLLVANLARQLVPTHEHRWLLPAAAATGVLATVLGQFIVTHALGLGVPLAVVINLIGGLYFLTLLMKAVRL